MISVQTKTLDFDRHMMARKWIEDRDVRIVGFGGTAKGIKEVQTMPYVMQRTIDGPPDFVGYDYRFTDDLAEIAMLFKLTFAGS